jgi:hypothetical protein
MHRILPRFFFCRRGAHYKQEQCASLFPRPGNHMSAMFHIVPVYNVHLSYKKRIWAKSCALYNPKYGILFLVCIMVYIIFGMYHVSFSSISCLMFFVCIFYVYFFVCILFDILQLNISSYENTDKTQHI